MSYHLVDPDDVDAVEWRSREIRSISDAAGLKNVSVNRFEAPPGSQLPLMYHAHDQQEEVFVVVSGELHVETPEETFVVDEGQCFAVEPGNPHRSFVPEVADGDAVVFAVGAPAVDDVQRYEP